MRSTLASSLTKAASRQTYYTISLLADRARRQDAYRAYAYFRWVDDVVDSSGTQSIEPQTFLDRQIALLDMGYHGNFASPQDAHEQMLNDLIASDTEQHSGLRSYLWNMMKVMQFDAERRGELISQEELDQYTYSLAVAVTEYLHHFIGHDKFAPDDGSRYFAVSAAHIAHMLRDLHEDLANGYCNIPSEVYSGLLKADGRLDSEMLRSWVKSRVELARTYFSEGKEQVSRMQSYRCRIACCAYISRFEWMLDTIEREGYVLRDDYADRKSTRAAIRMGIRTLSSLHYTRFLTTKSISRLAS